MSVHVNFVVCITPGKEANKNGRPCVVACRPIAASFAKKRSTLSNERFEGMRRTPARRPQMEYSTSRRRSKLRARRRKRTVYDDLEEHDMNTRWDVVEFDRRTGHDSYVSREEDIAPPSFSHMSSRDLVWPGESDYITPPYDQPVQRSQITPWGRLPPEPPVQRSQFTYSLLESSESHQTFRKERRKSMEKRQDSSSRVDSATLTSSSIVTASNIQHESVETIPPREIEDLLTSAKRDSQRKQRKILKYPSRKYLEVTQTPSRTRYKPSRKLLILDLNGTLVKKHRRGGRILAISRPYLNEFLEYVLTTFEVMVWSSAMPENVQKMVEQSFSKEQRKHLARVWDRRYFGFSRAEYEADTMCLKDLSIVWSQLDEYCWDQTNTVLIDDSREKCQLQPFNAIHPVTYSGEQQDEELKYLSEYLKRVCLETNVSNYIKEFPFKSPSGCPVQGQLTFEELWDGSTKRA